MDRLRRLFGDGATDQEYEPLEGGSAHADGERTPTSGQPFSWTEYSVFVLLGIAMLWAWNMFLAATPYFQRRFEGNNSLLRNFQPAILCVSTVGNLGSMVVLTKLQENADYPKRITSALTLNAVVFTLLALSTKLFTEVSAAAYFTFLMFMVLSASLATGMCQNGVFAYVSGFGRDEYTQAIMSGQGVAGVFPALTQIIAVLSVPEKQTNHGSPSESSTSALAYFLTATIFSAITLFAFFHLLSRASSRKRIKAAVREEDGLANSTHSLRKSVPLMRLFHKLFWLAGGVFLTFAITMFYPVFTGQIVSVRDPATAPRLLKPATFIPLGFFFWNLGDFIGRTGPALPALRLTHRPRLIFLLSIARLIFIPLYFLCNIGGRGAAVNSDFFYLFLVQLLFGVTNGYLGSSCMMGFAEWVETEELEAAGGFMSLALVSGLAVGSFLSFAAASA